MAKEKLAPTEVEEIVERLVEIRDEIGKLADEALDLVRDADDGEYRRGRAYWHGHIDGALETSRYHRRSGRGSMVTLSDAIEAIERLGDDADDTEAGGEGGAR